MLCLGETDLEQLLTINVGEEAETGGREGRDLDIMGAGTLQGEVVEAEVKGTT